MGDIFPLTNQHIAHHLHPTPVCPRAVSNPLTFCNDIWQGVEVLTSEPGLKLQVYRRFFRARTLVRLGGSDNGRDLATALTDFRYVTYASP